MRECTECTTACPYNTIRNVTAVDRYAGRDKALHFDLCEGRTYEKSLLPGICARICGICIMACPHGRSRKAVG